MHHLLLAGLASVEQILRLHGFERIRGISAVAIIFLTRRFLIHSVHCVPLCDGVLPRIVEMKVDVETPHKADSPPGVQNECRPNNTKVDA